LFVVGAFVVQNASQAAALWQAVTTLQCPYECQLQAAAAAAAALFECLCLFAAGGHAMTTCSAGGDCDMVPATSHAPYVTEVLA
jgi:hypothetical protein